MKLKKLLKDIPVKLVKGSKDVEITGVCSNSKLVSPGNLFVARKGRADDGNRYIPEAIAGGAVAVLTDILDPSLKDIVQIIDPDILKTEAALAAQYYQFPSNELFMVGITGTNGKTTTSFFIRHLLEKLGHSCGLMGTIEYIIGGHHYNASRTTPDVETNHKLLREMCFHGCDSAVMEVTSHALDQQRVAYIEYDAAIFTNLTLDHLDYHQTMQQYCAAKNRLFQSLDKKYKQHTKAFPKKAIVNVDSPWCKNILEGCKVPVLTYGIDMPADLRASHLQFSSMGTAFKISYQGKTVPCNTPVVGRYNIYNALAALAVCLQRGASLEKAASLLETLPPVSGRLEKVINSLDLKIYIDFAHSSDALANVLECLKEFKKGNMITVFGCGGDRDRVKRPKMAQAVEEHSDVMIVTSDNPRSENPENIAQEIIKGFSSSATYEIILDRRAAIKRAVDMATPEDIILIAGKGHEKFQVFAHKTVEFDDHEIAKELCMEKKQRMALQ